MRNFIATAIGVAGISIIIVLAVIHSEKANKQVEVTIQLYKSHGYIIKCTNNMLFAIKENDIDQLIIPAVVNSNYQSICK